MAGTEADAESGEGAGERRAASDGLSRWAPSQSHWTTTGGRANICVSPVEDDLSELVK